MQMRTMATTKARLPQFRQPARALSRRLLLAAFALSAAASLSATPAKGAADEADNRNIGRHTTNAAGSDAIVGGYYALSVAERALLGHYWTSLQSPGVADATREQVLRQLQRNPPVAFIAGYWATPIDLATVVLSSPIRNELQATLPASPAGEEASALMADTARLRQLAAVVFTADSARAEAGLPYVGELPQTREAEPNANGLFIVPVKDVDWSLSEYLPPPPEPGREAECYFYCSDAATWDFDGDGLPDIRDDDDDNDGTLDVHDAYPLWQGASRCECDAEAFVVLVTKFAVGIQDATLAAHAILAGLEESSTAVTLGRIGDGNTAIQFVLPAALVPLEERPSANDCPRPGAPGVSYVSPEPNDCAVLRFRCASNQVVFTNDCGCGCLDEASQ